MEHTVVNRAKLLHVKFKRPVTILNNTEWDVMDG